MNVRLPDPRGSRAVLIGTSSYDSADLKPLLAVRNNLEVLHELLTSDSGGFLPGRCSVVQDSSEPQEVCRTIREAAHEAPDTLLVYFSGHGILNYDYTELHLAMTGTDQNDLRWTSVPFQAIREIFETVACRNKILILDCCQSGWVLDSMMSAASSEPAAPLNIRGTYLLTSSSADLKSFAPPTDRYTAFTGELIQLLRDGLPGGAELLSLSALFETLATALEQRSMPRPQQQGSDNHAALALVRNTAVAKSGREADKATRAVGKRDAGRVPETRLTHDRWYRRFVQWGIGSPVMLTLIWIGVRFGPKEQESLDLTTPRGIVVAAAVGGMVLFITLLSRLQPDDYSLVIGSDGIEVRYKKKEHFYYPWHRVSRVWVVARPRGRLRGTQYALLLRPKPGVLIKTGRRGAPGPRRDDETGALHFANLRHLDAPPAAVEKALALTAGSAWTPSSGPLGRPAPVEEPVEVFSADRRLLAISAAASAGLAYLFFPTSVLTQPTSLWLRIVPLLFCAAACGVLWFCVSRIVRPVRLVISAAGVALTRADLEIAYAWSEIEQIGIVNWPRGLDSLGLLALRLTPQSGNAPVDRTAGYLPKLAVGCITICTLPEVTRDPCGLHAALKRFAGVRQLTPRGHAWLRSTPAKAARAAKAAEAMSGGTMFAGLRSTGAAVMLGIALASPTFCLSVWATDRHVPTLLDTLNVLILAQLPLLGLPAYFLTGRHRVTLHVGTSGLTLAFYGLRPHTLRVPWGDIESIGIVVRQHPSVGHSLVMWLRPGARPPRVFWWPRPQEYGGLRLISLEGSRLDATPGQLDRVIAHHAGHRHSRMERLPQPGPKNSPATD